MSTHSPALFPELFGHAPHLVRDFLHSALQLRGLDDLYAKARVSSGLELSGKILNLLAVELEITDEDLDRIPPSGPLMVVANHPFGILDGMLLDQVLLRARPDMKILTNALIARLDELRERCLPIDVFGTDNSLETNVRALRRVMSILRKGHGIAFFPAGEVSHWRREFGCIADPAWSSIAARCSIAADVPVVPLFFAGENSLGFQLAGLIHPWLRTARLPGELLNKRGRKVEVRVGSLIKPDELRRFQSIDTATDYLRARTYMLSHRKGSARDSLVAGLANLSQFRSKAVDVWRPATRAKEKPAPAPRPAARLSLGVSDEIARLEAQNKAIIFNDEYAVYLEQGNLIPGLVEELGRLREVTFRAAREGSGKARDLDEFDSYYHHLILWNKSAGQVAGSYRMAWTDQVLPLQGIKGLYTSTLFRFQPRFFARLGPALELGRSFICPEFQKEYAPLLLLWQGIARTAALRPDAPVLFGAVSISNEYSEASRELMVQFVSRHGFRNDLAHLAVPRHPFRSRLTKGFEFSTISRSLNNLEALAGPLSDIGDAGIPVLLRQYFKLGGQVAGFNVDRRFSNVLDGLLIVDLRETSPRMLDRYMGPSLSATYRAQLRQRESA